RNITDSPHTTACYTGRSPAHLPEIPMSATPVSRPRVGLFATCLMNVFRPSVGFAAVKLLEEAGCIVEVPDAQTCCGQPGYNSGDHDAARALAKQVINTFEPYEYVV